MLEPKNTNLCKPEVQRVLGHDLGLLFAVPLGLRSCLSLKASQMADCSAAVGLDVSVEFVLEAPLRLVPGQGLREAVTEAAEAAWQNKLDVVVVVDVGRWGLIMSWRRNGTFK